MKGHLSVHQSPCDADRVEILHPTIFANTLMTEFVFYDSVSLWPQKKYILEGIFVTQPEA